MEFFSSTPFEDEQLIQRFERSVEVKTFYLWSIWVSADFEQWRASAAARVKNPRLCNPIKVTGFISPDLTFSAPEDFMTLPMPSFYYLAAIMNVMHNIFFFSMIFQIVSFTEICNTHWKVFRFHEILILLVYSSGCRESISIFKGLHSVWKFPKKSHFSMFAPRAQLKYLNFIRICGYDFDHILARKFKYPKISNTKNITFLARKFKSDFFCVIFVLITFLIKMSMNEWKSWIYFFLVSSEKFQLASLAWILHQPWLLLKNKKCHRVSYSIFLLEPISHNCIYLVQKKLVPIKVP